MGEGVPRRRWLLVTKATDLERALATRSFRIVLKGDSFDEEAQEVMRAHVRTYHVQHARNSTHEAL